MIKHFVTKRSFGVLFLFLVIKPLVTVYHRYAIFLRPISPPTENHGCKPYELLPHNSCNLNYYHHICHIIVVYRTFTDILQPKTNRCNSVNSLIKKSERPYLATPLSDVYSIKAYKVQYTNTIRNNK